MTHAEAVQQAAIAQELATNLLELVRATDEGHDIDAVELIEEIGSITRAFGHLLSEREINVICADLQAAAVNAVRAYWGSVGRAIVRTADTYAESFDVASFVSAADACYAISTYANVLFSAESRELGDEAWGRARSKAHVAAWELTHAIA